MVDNLKRIIEAETKSKEESLYILGTLDAEEAQYEIQRSKIRVITINSEKVKNSTPKKEKGVEMKKNVSRRKDGRWVYSKQEDGMLYYAIASTYRDLLEKIPNIIPKEKKTKAKTQRKRKNSKNLQIFANYFRYFIDTYVKTKNVVAKTIESWENTYKLRIEPRFKSIKTEKLTTEIVQSFINSIEQERTQEVTYQRIVKVLRKAYATGKLKRDITLGLEKPKRTKVEERHPLTAHEQIALLKATKKTKIFTFVVFSIVVGSRRDETLGFDLSKDVDEKKLTIHIKGTKTANADRYVHVTKEFVQFLKENMKENTFNLQSDYVTHKLGDIFKVLGIDACLHSLRHTCSANLYFLGANDKYRQMQLGHASIVTTNDIYTNIKENIAPRYLRLIYGELYPRF